MTRSLEFAGVSTPVESKTVTWLPVAETLGHPVQIPVAVLQGARPGPRVLVSAGVHPPEYAAIEAAVQTYQMIDLASLDGTVVVVPVMNMPAFLAGMPYVVPQDGQNLNRVFPGNPTGTISLRIANTMLNEIAVKCDYIVDLHGGDLPEILFPFTIFFRTGNSEVDAKSERIARAFGTEYIWVHDEKVGNPGTFIGEAARRGVPGFVAEVGGLGSYAEEYVRLHVNGVQNVLKVLKMLPGQPNGVPADKQKLRHDVFSITAPVGGVFYPRVQPGDRVDKGHLMAEIKDVFGRVLAQVRAPVDATVRIVFVKRVANAGDTLMKCFVEP